MTLYDVIRRVEIIASHQPAINMIVRNDIFRLNERSDARYGVFGWTQGQHSASIDNNEFIFNFSFFYVDRLTEDGSNEIEVQSVGVRTLDNILRSLEDFDIVANGNYSFTTFNQRFNDECAGAFCSVGLVVSADSLCADTTPDYNNDFNDDFLIF